MAVNAALQVPDIEMNSYIGASPERVFDSITTAKGWDSWFTCGTSLDLKPGGRFILRWKEFGAKRVDYEAECSILEVAPNDRFVFQWSSGNCRTTITITLEALGEGTLVKVLETGYECTPEGLWGLMDCATGWGEALTLLKFYLEHGVTYGAVPAGN